jgi:hypothetical protein
MAALRVPKSQTFIEVVAIPGNRVPDMVVAIPGNRVPEIGLCISNSSHMPGRGAG